jgi:glycosyltransferase involved in cell wall biosynthesis
VHSLSLTKRSPWRLLRLRELVAKIDPDVIHAHLFHPAIASRFVSGRRRFSLINTVHLSEHRLVKRWLLLLDRWTFPRCDVQTVVSRATQQFHAHILGVPPEKLPVVHNGIHPPRPLDPSERTALRRAWGVEDCRVVLGSAGRLDRQKGYDLLLEALIAGERRIPSGETWGLVLLGSGPEKQALRKRAESLRRVRVVLPGFRVDAPRELGAFDVFVMPSRLEGFGLALVEAMAHGVPAVVSPVDSLPELIARYPLGSTCSFSGRSPEALFDAIEEAMSRPGRGMAYAPFTVERMVETYMGIYERALTRRRRESGEETPAPFSASTSS